MIRRLPSRWIRSPVLARLAAPRVSLILLLCLCLGLGACTGHRMAYNRLDWLASWRLSQYVELTSTQERRFETAFRSLWDWHRSQALPVYASELRELAQATQAPVTSEQLQAWAARAEAQVGLILEQGLPQTCPLVADLSDAQRDSLLARLDRDQDKRIEDYLEPPETKLRERAYKRLRRSVERWTGALEPVQLEQLRHWSQTRPLDYAGWIERRAQFRERLALTLDQRGAPDFCSQLRALFAPAEDDRPEAEAERAREAAWFDFLAQFSATLSERQRGHLRAALLELAEDFDQLHTAS